jgi:hypothetical protein
MDVTTGVVTSGTMSMSDAADLASSPLNLPFNFQEAFGGSGLNEVLLYRPPGT